MSRTRRRQRGGSGAAAAPPVARCQCESADGRACTETVARGSVYCANHATTCKQAPLNGYEPAYDPERYNHDPAVYKSHNCFSYSMNVIDPKLVDECRANNNNTNSCRSKFHQPGAFSGARNALNVSERRTCPVVLDLIKQDVPDVEISTYNQVCPAGKSKIALVVDPGEDYHFYRQDSDGMWSHKDGSNKVKRYDSLKQAIANPRTAGRDYRWQGSDLNYEDFCAFLCVPRDRNVVLGSGGGTVGGAARRSRSSVAGLSWKDHRRSRAQRTRRAQRAQTKRTQARQAQRAQAKQTRRKASSRARA